MGRRKTLSLPDREQMLDFIRRTREPVRPGEIARAFGVTGKARRDLDALVEELVREGQLQRAGRGKVEGAPVLPPVAVLEITGTDEDGEVLARPVVWRDAAPPPRIYVAPNRKGAPALGAGDRILARTVRIAPDEFEARVLRQLASEPGRVLGVYRETDGRGRLVSTDRRYRREYELEETERMRPGELILAEPVAGGRFGLAHARIVERLGHLGEAGTIDRIAIHDYAIPTEFAGEALTDAERAGPVGLGGRVDLRRVPFVTIDEEDARDFDDAVWAEPDPDLGPPGGFRLLVAIADVAHYVRRGSALDRAAYLRGNSVYFPDRAVPMLPEALSAHWCSLKPEEDRPAIVAEIRIDGEGRMRRHRFLRALVRSAVRLTYSSVEPTREGRPPDSPRFPARLVDSLYGAYRALRAARERRGALELDLAERVVRLSPEGEVNWVGPRPRLDSHRLIEEFMVAANVAAAETLEGRRAPSLYRVHEAPDPAKVEALSEFLESRGLRLARGQAIRPIHFNRLLERARERPDYPMFNELVLRTQAQARYSVDNLGHFALALRRYSHFTSPIRRYADLLVHRALIGALSLGEGGARPGEEIGVAPLAEVADHVSATERRAAAAERDAIDRYTVAFLANREGEAFGGRIAGVTRFGLFVTLEGTGTDGLVPVRSLPDDTYAHDAGRHALVGRRTGWTYVLGERVEVRLVEADPATGGLLLELLGAPETRAPRANPPVVVRRRRSPPPAGGRGPRRRGRGRSVSPGG